VFSRRVYTRHSAFLIYIWYNILRYNTLDDFVPPFYPLQSSTMPQRQDIDFLLRHWPFEPGTVGSRIVEASDGRKVMQMRIEMGVLQMEITGRPDGLRPGGKETYLDYLNAQVIHWGDSFTLTEEHRIEIDREFLQFYHRRICCLALREFSQAVADADHTLAMMDFVARWSNDQEWKLTHEQYRPFVIFHRAQAAALAEVQKSDPEAAIEQINLALDRIRDVYVKVEAEEQFDQDQLVNQLTQLKESLRNEYNLGRTLAEQLDDAVLAEQYERAARLRDEIAKRQNKQSTG
jgi:hypothetical protein